MAQNFQVSDLDFDTFKTNFINYLRTTSDFSDYDFSGSNLQALLNILAYNTHYNAILTNAAFNETFLDTAVKRGSVVSRAAELGYTPKSSRSSFATIALDIQNVFLQTPIVTIPEYYQFTTNVANTNYSFYTVANNSASASSTYEYVFPAINVYEGTKLNNSFIVSGDVSQKFVIPNIGIDTNSLRVLVSASSTSTDTVRYTKFVDLEFASATTTIYYLEENASGYYEFYFGDGVVSKALTAGMVVYIDYIVPSGNIANVSSLLTQVFAASTGIYGVDGTVLIRTVANSSGGSGSETIEEIKFNSKLSFERQNRVITAADFESYISSNYGNVASVSVYGGENNVPPVYGKVFICIQPIDNVIIGDGMKAIIAKDLRKNMNLAVTPSFVDPDYVYINIESVVKYNSNKTTVSVSQLLSNILVNLNNYFSQSISKFKGAFYYSQLANIISNTDSSIISNYQIIRLQKRISPILGTTISMNKVLFGSPLSSGTLYSNNFLYTAGTNTYVASIKDLNGILQVISIQDGSIIVPNCGSVNYASGIVVLNNLVISAYVGNEVYLKITSQCQVNNIDITPLNNQILVLDNSTFSSASNVKTGVSISLVNES